VAPAWVALRGVSPAGALQRSTCGAALETINWARERLARPVVTPADLARILSLLELSTENCSTDGDLWYYRYLLERETKAPGATTSYSLRKANEWRSEALAKNADPFARPAPAATVPRGRPAQKWALVVGVGDFTSPNIPPLDFTAKDAKDVAQALVDPSVGHFNRDNVRTLVDADATLTQVRQGIGWLRANAGRDDLVVVYVASHGSPRTLDPNGVSYVMMHDTDPSDAEHLYASALQMIDLADDLSHDLRAGRALLILDTCFSGDATELRLDNAVGTFSPSLERFARTPGRVILAAANGDQISWESAGRKNGYFTFHFLDALRRSQGRQPLGTLFAAVRDAVTTSVQREIGKVQTPLMSGSQDMNEFVLGEAAAAPPV
jgi:uncharacterized caspase-like protein